jgi:CO/xanthine dehydrogenase Mo-binding subunit
MTGALVGRRVPRTDAVEKVTGAAVYTTDIEIAGMAHAVLVRSPVPHGVLRAIDVAAAERHPGVIATLAGAEIAALDPYFGEWVLDQPPLAIDRVRFVGEPVVGIVAETERAALEAAELVELDIDPLPALTTVDDALEAGDVAIHPERDSADDVLPNVCYRAQFEHGDVEAAMASAAYVHRAVYRFPSVSHYAMEPHACIAAWGPDGLDVWAGTQQPFKVRADLARIFKLALSRVRVRVPFVGGGYGGKGQSKYEPVTVALARKAGRPVRLVVGVEGSFQTVRRHGAVVEMATAVDGDGKLIARDTRILYDTGAYADKGPRVARKGAYRATGPYGIPNARAVALAVYTNTIPAGAFRGFSTPQVVWAGESAIDEVAHELGVDPVAFRHAQLAQRGDPFFADDTPLDADLRAGLTLASEALDSAGGPPPGRGRGVAVGVKDGGGGTGTSQATVRVHPDGSIEVLVGTSELGQGSRTVFAQIVAEELGAPLAAVAVRFTDTDVAPFDRGTNASRSTVAVGSAVLDAARMARAEIVAAAEQAWGEADGLALGASGEVSAGSSRTSLRRLLASARGVPEAEVAAIVAHGRHDVAASETPLGSSTLFYEVGHGAAEVEVDAETGAVRIVRYASVADVGRALNPVTVEGQDEGAAMMAIGHTLFEELEYDGGEPLNTNLFDYRVPRAEDVPEEFRTLLLELGDGPGPHGAKGAGEGGIIPLAPAVANAVFAATGVRIRDLPMTPERVWRALRDDARPGRSEETA